MSSAPSDLPSPHLITRPQELGAVDHAGLNVNLLSYRAKAGWLAWLSLRR
jgi:hypothetical protein